MLDTVINHGLQIPLEDVKENLSEDEWIGVEPENVDVHFFSYSVGILLQTKDSNCI